MKWELTFRRRGRERLVKAEAATLAAAIAAARAGADLRGWRFWRSRVA